MKTQTYAHTAAVEKRHWWFRARGKIVQAMLRRFLPVKSSLKILDIGCGTGGDYEILKPFGEVTGVDAFPEAVEFCKAQGWNDVSVGDATALSFADGTFDLVCCLDVLNAIQDDAKAAAEAVRVTKSGGTLLFTIAAHQWLWGKTDVASQHVRRYNRAELKKLFQRADCEILHCTAMNIKLLPLVWFSRLLESKQSEGEITGLTVPPGWLNQALYVFLMLESLVIPWIPFPLGVSEVIVVRKR